MTKIEVVRKHGKIIRYGAKGHTNYDTLGKDIVCAAVSTVLQTPIAGMLYNLNLKPKFKINEDGFLDVNIENMDVLNKGLELDALLESMLIMLKELENQYPKNVKLVMKEEN